MSKSLNLYAGAVVGVGVVLTAAANFADRFVSPLPGEARMMTDAPNSAYGLVIAAANAQPGPSEGPMGIGRKALPEEIAAWDLDISPDATELPVGSGSVTDGETLFSNNCAVCHGEFAEGVGNWPKLAGGDGTLADKDPVKTVGSYWPYLSTAWDYVHRSMPFGGAQTLTVDETYAITAYILYSNYLVEDDFVLSNENFLEVEMPNADGFIVDDREEAEAHFWNAEPCMENCKDSVEITMRAAVLDVTPEEESATEEASDMAVAEPEAAPSEPATEQQAVEAAVETAALDADLVADGEKVFKKCQACHMVGEGAKNRVGPHLNDVVGRTVGGLDGFNYSGALAEMGEAGKTWTEAELAAFLENPRSYAKGTKMSFAGLKKEDDQAAIVEYLRSHSQ
ncbi:c-type cytochrome [Roseovarius aestuariivivens]|uniref:c-type cytochrome n=1 Tax=Roseovarius aestuariivivens TaxID=1888910 RepID=UPI001082273D|nr:c-type cytochrome [Roseovarius aestuariivivens]